MKLFALTIAVTLGGLAAGACSSSKLDGFSGKSSKDGEETSNKPSGEGSRPTDESEGVPGYLVDPSFIKAVAEDGVMRIKGEPGTVGALDKELQAITVSVYEVPAAELEKKHQQSEGVVTLPATRLLAAQPAADGSFELELPEAPADPVVVSVLDQEAADKLSIKNSKSGKPTSAIVKIDGKATALGVDDLSEEGELEEDGGTTAAKTGTDTDTDTATEGPTSCGGKLVGGACWYLSGTGGTCTVACSSHGGYDEATATYAGSGGTLARCAEVLNALGINGAAKEDAEVIGLGCFSVLGQVLRIAGMPTSADASLVLARRACACKE